MLDRVNHIAIAVSDLSKAVATYRDLLGANVSDPVSLPEHGVTTVFVTLENTKIELLEPLGDKSPIASFLRKNPSGGVHHICYEVIDIMDCVKRLEEQGARILGDIKIGAHGKPVLFLHPKDFCGTLIELEEK